MLNQLLLAALRVVENGRDNESVRAVVNSLLPAFLENGADLSDRVASTRTSVHGVMAVDNGDAVGTSVDEGTMRAKSVTPRHTCTLNRVRSK